MRACRPLGRTTDRHSVHCSMAGSSVCRSVPRGQVAAARWRTLQYVRLGGTGIRMPCNPSSALVQFSLRVRRAGEEDHHERSERGIRSPASRVRRRGVRRHRGDGRWVWRRACTRERCARGGGERGSRQGRWRACVARFPVRGQRSPEPSMEAPWRMERRRGRTSRTRGPGREEPEQGNGRDALRRGAMPAVRCGTWPSLSRGPRGDSRPARPARLFELLGRGGNSLADLRDACVSIASSAKATAILRAVARRLRRTGRDGWGCHVLRVDLPSKSNRCVALGLRDRVFPSPRDTGRA